MDWSFDESKPLYAQIVAAVKLAIASGELLPGERLPAVRELALEAGVNPNTVQRALTELERQGLVHTQRTAGRFVTQDQAAVQEARRELAGASVGAFLTAMGQLGYTGEELLALLRREMEKEEK